MNTKMEFDFEPLYRSGVKIKVIGVGGGGNNAVNRMISANISGVEFIAVNTDAQVLDSSFATKKLVLGNRVTRGFGAGANPEVGRRAAEESVDDIKALLLGTDMLFVTAGMGGGTGTGAAPVIARVARELEILTVGIVTKPFKFEGAKRAALADQGIAELSKYVDSLIVIPNQRLKSVESARISLANAFEIADDVLRCGVQSISEIISVTGFVNRDFADVTTIMKDAGYAHMGVGSGKGADKAKLAATAAISSPLLETSISGATRILMNITASEDIKLEDVEIAADMVHDEARPDATIIWGAAFNPELHDEMKMTIIATGFIDPKTNKNGESNKTIESAKAKEIAQKAVEAYAVTEAVNVAPTVEDITASSEAEEVVSEPVADEPAAEEIPTAGIIRRVKSKPTTEEELAEEVEEIFEFIKRKAKPGF